MKILNLYANVGGNRKLWGDEHEITSVELLPSIAEIYHDLWPNDEIVVADAHEYLLEHFDEYDFIWSSPPCPTHSTIRKATSGKNHKGKNGYHKPMYPSMVLYEEILLLKGYFEGKWCVENVISWYEPLIPPQEMGGHYFWANFYIPIFKTEYRMHEGTIKELEERKGFDLSKYKGIDKRLALRDMTEPELGKHILESSTVETHASLFS